MPFPHEMKSYTKASILNLKPDQNGVYGIFRGDRAVYVGSGDIRDRMLAHIDEDNPCITQNTPNQWTSFLVSGDPTGREGELIQEYSPICNKQSPR